MSSTGDPVMPSRRPPPPPAQRHPTAPRKAPPPKPGQPVQRQTPPAPTRQPSYLMRRQHPPKPVPPVPPAKPVPTHEEPVEPPQESTAHVEEPQYTEEDNNNTNNTAQENVSVSVEEPQYQEEGVSVEEPQYQEEGVSVDEPQYEEENPENEEKKSDANCADNTAQGEEEERKEKRELAVKELIETETIYYQDLMVITSVFLDPMKNNPNISKLLTPVQFRDIFSNFEVLLQLHSDILSLLLQPDCKVADAFLQYVAYFRMYVMYCNNLDKQDATIHSLLASSPAFAAFAAECKRRPECRSLDMLAFLIKPLQRICKYPLLFREIIKYSLPDDLETKRLKDVESQLQQVLTKINTQKRMVDTSSKVLELQERLVNKHGPVPALISPARRFLRHGPVVEIDLTTKKIKEMQHILCSDMLVRVSKKVGSSQLEVITMSHLDSVGVLRVDSSFKFPRLGWKWSSLKPEDSLELLIHLPNEEHPLHLLACYPGEGDVNDWFGDFEDAKKNLLENQNGMLPLAV